MLADSNYCTRDCYSQIPTLNSLQVSNKHSRLGPDSTVQCCQRLRSLAYRPRHRRLLLLLRRRLLRYLLSRSHRDHAVELEVKVETPCRKTLKTLSLLCLLRRNEFDVHRESDGSPKGRKALYTLILSLILMVTLLLSPFPSAALSPARPPARLPGYGGK